MTITGTSPQPVRVPRAPYSLDPCPFPFPALAGLAGRAPLGGQREVALACFLAARLVVSSVDGSALTAEQRQGRGQAARNWLGSVAVPQPVKTALARLLDSASGDGRGAILTALESVIAVTANHLDQAARLELARLAQALAE